MALYAIGDLHLSFSSDKPMDIFGENWVEHAEKIKVKWIEKIGQEDVVLIPGDISWATTLEEAMIDLKWIDDLPGKKILLRGNHDYWWTSVSKLNALFESMTFLQNTFFNYGDYAICGARGWDCPNEKEYTEHDQKIYNREQIRLKLSLDAAKKAKKDKIVVMMHYPPIYEGVKCSDFMEILETYGVSKVVYGHIHTVFTSIVEGTFNAVSYDCVSCDYINFDPIKVLD